MPTAAGTRAARAHHGGPMLIQFAAMQRETVEVEGDADRGGLCLEVLDDGVEKDNPDACRLYERLGFAEVGETEQECKLRWNPLPNADLPSAPTGIGGQPN
jgi:hypothetical protein